MRLIVQLQALSLVSFPSQLYSLMAQKYSTQMPSIVDLCSHDDSYPCLVSACCQVPSLVAPPLHPLPSPSTIACNEFICEILLKCRTNRECGLSIVWKMILDHTHRICLKIPINCEFAGASLATTSDPPPRRRRETCGPSRQGA